MNEPHLRLTGVSKSYGQESAHTPAIATAGQGDAHSRVYAVDDISLDIACGTRLGIVGPNGAGKSTLLHLIAGLTDATRGDIEVQGRVTAILTLGIGLREDLSGRENIYLDGELHGHTRKEVDRFIDRIIDFADLGRFIDYPLRTYSTGMKARLAFSMISHLEPEILIIDETLAVGDATFSVKAMKRIREICDAGRIVILVSHSLGAVRDLCNRCLWLQAGRVIMDGSPAEVTKAYADSVRSEDERELMRRFGDRVGSRSTRQGWMLEEAVVLADDSAVPSVLVEAGVRCAIRLRGIIEGDLQGVALRLRIVRLDDEVMLDDSWSAAQFVIDGRLQFELSMEPLLLGAATYRVDAALGVDATSLAESSSIFEVTCSHPPSGGKPMLLARPPLHVHRLQ